MTQPDPFCPRCQQIRAECVCVSDHSLSRERASVEGHGDTPLSPQSRPSRRGNQRKPRLGDTGTPGTPPPRRTSWTAAELMAAQFPPLKWAVKGLVAEGVTLVAGPPKIGKSWFALGLCVSVSSGGKALGTIDCEPGESLYLALEDSGRRLHDRMNTILRDAPPPPGMVLATECPPTNQGGLDLISRWLDGQRNPRLIIVDVFEKIRGPAHPGESAYTADYNAVTAIKRLADERHVGIMLMHHVRKVTSTDFINEISGTLGLGGAADTIMVLRRDRGQFDGQLLITGRDVDEQEYAVKYVPELGSWQLLGLASEYGLADTRHKILSFVREHDGARPKEIALGTGLDHELVKKTVARMAADSQLHTDAGRYFVPPPTVPLSPDDHNPRS